MLLGEFRPKLPSKSVSAKLNEWNAERKPDWASTRTYHILLSQGLVSNKSVKKVHEHKNQQDMEWLRLVYAIIWIDARLLST